MLRERILLLLIVGVDDDANGVVCGIGGKKAGPNGVESETSLAELPRYQSWGLVSRRPPHHYCLCCQRLVVVLFGLSGDGLPVVAARLWTSSGSKAKSSNAAVLDPGHHS